VPSNINVNMLTVVHKDSGGMLMTFPDVCKTPAPPAGPIPIPYPNIAQSTDTADGSETVKMEGNPILLKGSKFSQSSGDEAGSAGGVMSSSTKGQADPMLYSFDVKVDGKNVCRLSDIMMGNKKNTPPMPLIQAPLIMLPQLQTPTSTKDYSIEAPEVDEEAD
jgi:uncharacterized Zn-binding protein involved in type VI secretion